MTTALEEGEGITNVMVSYFIMFHITLCDDGDVPPRQVEGTEIVLLCIRRVHAFVFVHKDITLR